MQRSIRLIVLICCLAFFKSNFSQDIRGGYFQYKWIGGYTYSVNFNLILDSASLTTHTNLAIYFGDGDSSIVSTTTTNVGKVLIYRYSFTHTYAGPGNYNNYVNAIYRISNIKNISVSQNKSMFLSDLINHNPFWGPNSSPVLTSEPIIFTNTGSLVSYNPGMVDIDGDSLSYHKVSCIAYPYPSISYYPPSNSNISPNGTFTYQADTTGLYAFNILIKEWRKDQDGFWQTIGTTNLDFIVDVVASVGIKEFDKKEIFSIYPNPTSNILNIKTNSKTNSEIEITNQLGQTVLKQKFSESIDVSKHSPGCYFIRIDNSYSKFIKE